MASRPSLLIISFSPLRSDARVLKQIRLFAADYDVTTCGYGDAPDGVHAHFSVPDSEGFQHLDPPRILLRQYHGVYWRIPAVRWAKEHLPRQAHDVILANEPESAGLALWLKPRRGIHADLHEYTPRLKDEFPSWAKRIKPFWEWVCRRYVSRADSWTTVSPGIIDAYEEKFGFRPDLVTNAAPFRDAEPTPVAQPIRLVHGGVCLRNRRLDILIDAVELTSAAVTLDFYLAPNDPGFLDELKARASTLDNVRIHDPLPYAQLIPALAGYDVGVHVLPPTNFNNAWALPNKLFEFAQARLGVIVGPSPEMARYVQRFGFGAVAAGFDATDLAAQFDLLTAERVTSWKAAAHAHARDLSAESQLPVWKRAIDRLAALPGGDAAA